LPGRSSRALWARLRSTARATGVAALLGVILLMGGCGADDEVSPPPNVVFVLLDTLRTDHLSSYGYPWTTSPTIDAVAQRGVLFEDCTAQASWTLPSMISLLTGQPIFRSIYRLPDGLPMMPELFAQAGYRTGAMVANSALAADRGFARGSQTYDVRQLKTAQWNAEDVTDKALAFLDAGDERPFFLWAHYLDTHEPYTPPTRPFTRRYNQVFDDWEQQLIKDTIDGAPESERVALSAQRARLAGEIDRYDGELLYLDGQLARLFARLDELGLTDNTLIVIAADHGETLFRRPEHPQRVLTTRAWRTERELPMELTDYVKSGHAYWVYQELVRTPLIIAGPGVRSRMTEARGTKGGSGEAEDSPPGQGGAGRHDSGRRVSESVSNLDLLPTLLGLAGLDVLDTPGRDLSSALRSGSAVPAAEFVTSCSDSATSARLPDGTKVILPDDKAIKNHGLVAELFQLGRDPLERDPRPLGEQGQRLAQRLTEAMAADPFAAWQGEAMDAETLQRLRELGYLR